MAYCSNCGSPISPDAKYCSRCGTPVAVPDTATVSSTNPEPPPSVPNPQPDNELIAEIANINRMNPMQIAARFQELQRTNPALLQRLRAPAERTVADMRRANPAIVDQVLKQLGL